MGKIWCASNFTKFNKYFEYYEQPDIKDKSLNKNDNYIKKSKKEESFEEVEINLEEETIINNMGKLVEYIDENTNLKNFEDNKNLKNINISSHNEQN